MAKVIYTYNNQILKSTDNEWYTGLDIQPPTLIYSNNTEDTAIDGTNTYNINLGNYPFTLFQITQKIDQHDQVVGACDMWLEFNGKTGTWPAHSANVWRFRSHFSWGEYQSIRCCQLYTDTNPADWCNDLQSNVTIRSPQDNETCYYYNQSSPSPTTYAVHSLLINNSTGIAKHYIDDNYTCSGNLVTGDAFTAIAKVRERNYSYCYKDIYIYGASNESDLINIITG